MNTKDEFMSAIKVMYGNNEKEFIKTWAITEAFLEKAKNEEKGKYGDCDSLRNLLILIRREMVRLEFAPKKGIPRRFNDGIEKGKEHTEILIGENEDTKYSQMFRKAYMQECENANGKEPEYWSYSDDGLDYSKHRELNNKNCIQIKDNDWITNNNKHYYYNQYDHWISYMAGAIVQGNQMFKTNKNSGLKEIRAKILESEVVNNA